MKVSYDNSLKVGGIGISPWTRLGPEKWFPEYKIASFFPPDEGLDGMPRTYSIYGNGARSLPRYNSVNLLKEPAFAELLRDEFSNYKLFTYKSAASPKELEKYLLRQDERYAELAKKLENKAEFRRHFASGVVRFPNFVIYDKSDILAMSTPEALIGDFSQVMIQDAVLSGGKGSFLVKDQVSFEKAKVVLAKSAATEVVVSEVVSNPTEQSIQCVATKKGIFMGPAQIQLIDEPLLINRNVTGAEKFCGVVIDPSLTSKEHQAKMRAIAEEIGGKILEMGYVGIFGIDFLVDDRGEVFVLEVNPRITGATPLLTAFYSTDKDIPFYLLHILEIMNQGYEIDFDPAELGAPSGLSSGSLMILHSQEAVRVEVKTTMRTGIYSADLTYLKPSVLFDDVQDGQYLIQSIAPVGVKASPAARLLTIYYKGSVLDENGKISKKIQADIRTMYKNIKLVEATNE